MITRGYLIGFIIDELADIVIKASWRTKLNLNDISIFSEDFFATVLNLVYSLELKNLNPNNSNNPGIDIGDKKMKIAYQVSLNVNMTKIKDTIEIIEKNSNIKNDFKQFRFFAIGTKQKTYNVPTNNFNIDEKSIYDINDINKEILSLDIDTLISLKNYIEKESRKVKMEFEVPDEQGNYETSLFEYLEKLPCENIENAINLLYPNLSSNDYSEIESEFKEFINKLKKLPRITREFIAIIIDRSEKKKGTYQYRLEQLQKILHYDFDSDLSISCEENLLDIDENYDTNEIAYKTIYISNDFLKDIKDFVDKNQISSRKFIVSLDFRE